MNGAPRISHAPDRAGVEARIAVPAAGRRRALLILALATFFTMSVWFSASFIADQLAREWQLTATGSSLLTIAVQAGFIVGALGSGATGLADMLPGRRLVVIGAAAAALANLSLLLVTTATAGIAARFLTGIALALVYPPTLKEVATWFRQGRGLALGIMIGSLTLGSALPHLVMTFGDVSWRAVIVATSALAASGAALAASLRRSGPYPFGRSRFHLGEALRSLRVKAVALADIGYIGHMWELYAMWAWIGVFIGTVPPFDGHGTAANVIAFAVIGVGAIGCLVGGLLSDRVGRAYSALVSLLFSGSCAVALVFSSHFPAWLTITVCFVWGFWVIADSAQFSAIVTEHAVQQFVGSALSLQLAAGYATTVIAIWLVPHLAEHYSWGTAVGVLALGPAVGSVAMWRCHRIAGAG
jgi:MFS family permease